MPIHHIKKILVRSSQEQQKQQDDGKEGKGQQDDQHHHEAEAPRAGTGLLAVGQLAVPDPSCTEKTPCWMGKHKNQKPENLDCDNKNMEPATEQEDYVDHHHHNCHRHPTDDQYDQHRHPRADDRLIAASTLLDLIQNPKSSARPTATESVTEAAPRNHNLRQYEGEERRPSKRIMVSHLVPETQTYQNVIHPAPFHSSHSRRYEDHHHTPMESQPFKRDSHTVVYQQDHPVYFKKNEDLASNRRNVPFHSSHNTTLSYADYIRLKYELEMEELVLNKMVQDMWRNRSYPMSYQRMLQQHYYHQYHDNPRDNPRMPHASNQNTSMPTSNSPHKPSNGLQQFQMGPENGVNRFEGIRRAGQCFVDDACPPLECTNRMDDNFISDDTSSVATSSAMSYPMRMPDSSAPNHNHCRNSSNNSSNNSNSNNNNIPKRSHLDRDISSQSHLTEKPLSDRVQPFVVTDASSVMSSSIRSHLSTRTISDCNDEMLKHLFTKEPEKSMDISCLDESSRAVGSNSAPVYRAPFPLGIATDDLHLSDFFQFLRAECCEVFTAGADEVEQRKKTKTIRLHQVGIRCTFCANAPYTRRALRSSCYPSSLSRIYQSMTMMVRDHFSICSCLPKHVRERYHHIKANSQRKGNIESRSYWVIAAKMIGIVETEYGLFFMSDAPPIH